MKKQTWLKVGILVAIVVGILVIDLVTKYVLYAQLEDGVTYTIIPYLFSFRKLDGDGLNHGAAWGIMNGKEVFLIVLSFVFLAIFIFYFVKEKNKTWLLTTAFGFLIGGCLGNLYDRIVLGGVRDFIRFAFWDGFPTFNFADAFLSVGVVLFVIYLIVYFVKNNKKESKNTLDLQENNEKSSKNENEDKNV